MYKPVYFCATPGGQRISLNKRNMITNFWRARFGTNTKYFQKRRHVRIFNFHSMIQLWVKRTLFKRFVHES